MPNMMELDGHLVTYEASPPKGRAKKLLHVNGILSSQEKQLRDLEALVWLTLDHPLDVMGIHNSTQGFQSDMLESLLGKAELYSFWSERRTSEAQNRLNTYASLIRQLVDQSLEPDCDILQVLQKQTAGQLVLPTAIAERFGLDVGLIQRLPILEAMNFGELTQHLYGNYPAGAPRATLRLAYEMIRAIREGCEVWVAAHSQGTIIAALAFHIVDTFFADYDKWVNTIRFVGYGPVIMFEDLPSQMRSRSTLIQHREDLVAEALSNQRNVDMWRNVQSQIKKVIENAEKFTQLIHRDSHHSASHYLGLTVEPSGKRSATLIQQLLMLPKSSPLLDGMGFSRIILENSD